MKRDFRCYAPFFLICVILSGCVNLDGKESLPVLDDEAGISEVPDTTPTLGEEEPIDIFLSIVPAAQIVQSISSDISGDEKEDLVVLYALDEGETKISAGVAVCLRGYYYGGLDLSGGKDLTFHSEGTLMINGDDSIVSFDLLDPATSDIYKFHVTFRYDELTSEAEFIIDSEVNG